VTLTPKDVARLDSILKESLEFHCKQLRTAENVTHVEQAARNLVWFEGLQNPAPVYIGAKGVIHDAPKGAYFDAKGGLHPPVIPPLRPCEDCKLCNWNGDRLRCMSTALFMVPIGQARSKGGLCGPKGDLFEAKS
jgi:hypothetical protein